MSSLIQNILIVGGVLAILGLGYFLYTQNKGLEATDAQLSAQLVVESEDFLRRLNELKAIELDGSIFSDPRFVSLINYSLPIRSDSVGNRRPFDLSN